MDQLMRETCRLRFASSSCLAVGAAGEHAARSATSAQPAGSSCLGVAACMVTNAGECPGSARQHTVTHCHMLSLGEAVVALASVFQVPA
jgi:hypothetical protein